MSVDDCNDPEASAEGAHLALWAFDQLKAKKHSLAKLEIQPLDENKAGKEWTVGKRKGVNFINIYSSLFSIPVPKSFPKLFFNYSSGLDFFGAKISAQKLIVKC